MTEFFDALETREPAQREAELLAALPRQVAHAKAHARGYRDLLADVDPRSVTSREALARLPVLRKSELLARQAADAQHDPFGGFATIGWGPGSATGKGRALRVFASPGPIHEPEGQAPDYWRTARALYAAGFRAGDLVHNGYSYHLTPAGSMMESGAHAIGCTVFPGGTGQTEQQVRAMQALRPAGYAGTPSFLKIILEKADELGVPLPWLRRALVSGEALPPALRDWLQARGVRTCQCYATADLGLIAYEAAPDEPMVLDEGIIVEIVRPGGTEPVPDGEVGELVVTTLNPDYPLIRFGTGDLSALLPPGCPTGRTNARIKGWLGRADQATKVRGMFVHPSQVAAVVERHPEVLRARLVISGTTAEERMVLRIETAQPGEAVEQRVLQTLRDVTRLRGEVERCDPGTLPGDGKVIEDTRGASGPVEV